MKLQLAAMATLALGVAACTTGADATADPPLAPAATTTDATQSAGTSAGNSDDGAKPKPPPPPSRFGTVIDNPYFPMAPGTTWTFRNETEDGLEKIVVKVTDRTRMIEGIEARVVRDTVTLDGEVIEDTFDWYAQDDKGNIWYLGENTKEYENGEVVSTHGSWEHGKDGAIAGILMKAHPKQGDEYFQEYYKGEAEDEAEVLSTRGNVDVPAGSFKKAVVTFDFTELDPDSLENKYYARGIGPVLEVDIRNNGERTELVKIQQP